jgi:hypothetical protein
MGRHAAAKPAGRSAPRSGQSRIGGSTSAVADLQLILHNRRLLVSCALTAVLPFAVYFAVIIALGKSGDWALFIFAPMIFAGVVVGALLDRAYDRAMAESAPATSVADDEQLAA